MPTVDVPRDVGPGTIVQLAGAAPDNELRSFQPEFQYLNKVEKVTTWCDSN